MFTILMVNSLPAVVAKLRLSVSWDELILIVNSGEYVCALHSLKMLYQF